MEWQDRVVVDPNILAGKPVIKGTRLAVEFIIELLANGWSNSAIWQDSVEPKPFKPLGLRYQM